MRMVEFPLDARQNLEPVDLESTDQLSSRDIRKSQSCSGREYDLRDDNRKPDQRFPDGEREIRAVQVRRIGSKSEDVLDHFN